jgi:hypothetical protein
MTRITMAIETYNQECDVTMAIVIGNHGFDAHHEGDFGRQQYLTW